MRKILLIVIFVLSSFLLSGCYFESEHHHALRGEHWHHYRHSERWHQDMDRD